MSAVRAWRCLISSGTKKPIGNTRPQIDICWIKGNRKPREGLLNICEMSAVQISAMHIFVVCILILLSESAAKKVTVLHLVRVFLAWGERIVMRFNNRRSLMIYPSLSPYGSHLNNDLMILKNPSLKNNIILCLIHAYI